jgi:DNA (cytosine-5)-methyltransferase 1
MQIEERVRYTHASLFSGIGGAEIAASWLGWENVFHCEIQEFPRRVLEYWYPNSTSYEDITKTDFSAWKGKIDVLTGGFPCQPFSLAGSHIFKNLFIETPKEDIKPIQLNLF